MVGSEIPSDFLELCHGVALFPCQGADHILQAMI